MTSRCEGSALVELIVISGVMITFMIGIPMVGTMVDLKQTAIQASRYAAWEMTVQTNQNFVAKQVDARFFRSPSAPIRTSEPAEKLLGHNTLWGQIGIPEENDLGYRDSSEDGNPFGISLNDKRVELYKKARVSISAKNVLVSNQEMSSLHTGSVLNSVEKGDYRLIEPTGQVYAEIGGAVSAAGAWLHADAWGGEGPRINGLMRSQVEVKLDSNRFIEMIGNNCLQGGAGCFHESTAILTDGWAAAHPVTIRDRVRGFVPTHKLEKVGSTLSMIAAIPMLKDIGNLDKAFGCIKLHVLPGKEVNSQLPAFKPMDDYGDC